MRLMARLHKGTARFKPWFSLRLKAFKLGLGRSAEEARGAYRELELAAFLSLDHGANFGAKGVEGEGFCQHVHARLEKLASKRSVLGVSGYEKYF